MDHTDYRIIIDPLSPDDGGGFVASVPDLPGCMSDGRTPEEALSSVRDAITEWVGHARQLGRDVPPPTPHPDAPEWRLAG